MEEARDFRLLSGYFLMIQKIVYCATALVLSAALSGVASANNLISIYRQGLQSDPTFKKAQADWLTARVNIDLAITGTGTAGSGLLPNLTATGQITSTYQKVTSGATAADADNHFSANSYLISLTQPVFNFATWQNISSARYTVKAATATYLAAAQDLMARSANAYFEVLRAYDQLRLTLAQKEQFLHQLITAQQKFKVGLIAITGVYDAEASYDNSIADEIKDRNNLQNTLEDLRAITGKFYWSLAGLRPNIPLVIPSPRNMSKWVNIANKQNYLLQADINAMLSKQKDIKVAEGGWYPNVNVVGGWGTSTAATALTFNTSVTTGSVGVQLNVPVFRGGFDYANTKQARYSYLSASDQLEIDHRNIENQTRQAYLGVDSGISQIKADQQAVLSGRNQLEATRAGYVVGTRTMVDVLESVTNLTQAQQSYANDRYNYVESIVSLKQQAGTLSPNDIARLNSWLKTTIKFNLRQPTVKKHKIAGIPTSASESQIDKVDLLDINTPSQTEPLPKVEKEGSQYKLDQDKTYPNRDLNSSHKKKHSPSKKTSAKAVKHVAAKPEGAKAKLLKTTKPVTTAPGKITIAKKTDVPKATNVAKPVTPSLKATATPTPEKALTQEKVTTVLPAPFSVTPLVAAKVSVGPVNATAEAKTKVVHTAGHNYVIQLFSDHSRAVVEHFIAAQVKSNSLPVNGILNVKHRQDNSGEWYSVQLGGFSTYSEAQAMLQHLSKPLKVYKPWIVRS